MTDYTLKADIEGNKVKAVLIHKKSGIAFKSEYTHDQSELIALIRAFIDIRKQMEPIVKGLAAAANIPEWPEDETRIDIVGSNGNDGLHYSELSK